MNIKEVKNAIKIGYFVLQKHNENLINIKYLPNISEDVLKSDVPRVYLFVQDGIIKKIGGSAGEGGIKVNEFLCFRNEWKSERFKICLSFTYS